MLERGADAGGARRAARLAEHARLDAEQRYALGLLEAPGANAFRPVCARDAAQREHNVADARPAREIELDAAAQLSGWRWGLLLVRCVCCFRGLRVRKKDDRLGDSSVATHV